MNRRLGIFLAALLVCGGCAPGPNSGANQQSAPNTQQNGQGTAGVQTRGQQPGMQTQTNQGVAPQQQTSTLNQTGRQNQFAHPGSQQHVLVNEQIGEFTPHVTDNEGQIHSMSIASTSVSAIADRVIAAGKSTIGKAVYDNNRYSDVPTYRFGCGGFVYFAFKKAGIDLATMQPNYQVKLGTAVAKSDLQKGDIVFFDTNRNDADPVTHNGIYIGDNKIIHMADPGLNVIISDLSAKAFYRDNYVTARRVIPSYLSPATATRSKGQAIADYADSLIGRAKYGGNTNASTLTFSNAGFIRYVYQKNGIDVGALATDQIKKGTTVSRNSLKPGDLVFFKGETSGNTPGTVAIYAGNYRLILMTNTGVEKRVLFVDWYTDHYLTARRVVS
ncbi:C40 family peptidase [Brevibacillus dissolubilis]|uniref:C40 family peptidase n=1 Tax=Brevibacillus dissolubilis TaxID=1844116 RepID=UPI00111749A2|nr:NlpC/P60 family protein [Brevibacillus dissolubilis]